MAGRPTSDVDVYNVARDSAQILSENDVSEED